MARLLSMAWLAAAAVCANVFAKRTGHHRHHRDRADAVEHERRAEIVAQAKGTIPYLREMLCGRVTDHPLLIVVVVGEDGDELGSRYEGRLLAGNHREKPRRVSGWTQTRWRLRGAGSTNNFDFRRFEDVDAVVARSTVAYWQELVAAHPKARVRLVKGRPWTRPAPAATAARLTRCAALRDHLEADEFIAAYGSACPSAWQRAKVEDQVFAEIVETVPDRLQVYDGFFDRTGTNIKGNDYVHYKSTTKTVWNWTHVADDFFPKKSQNTLLIGPGWGETATHSLYLALDAAGVGADGRRIDHFTDAVELTRTAPEDDAFDWAAKMGKYAGLLDTPIPGFWRELNEAFPSSRIVLTWRRDYERSYPSRVDTSAYGPQPWGWRRGLADVDEGLAAGLAGLAADASDRRGLSNLEEEGRWCSYVSKCDEACVRILEQGTTHLAALEDAGDWRCDIKDKVFRDASVYARRAAAALLGGARLPLEHKSRAPVFHALCPSKMQAVKMYRNTNRHVLRRVPDKRLLVLNVVDAPHDGYARLCPFLDSKTGACGNASLGFFPRRVREAGHVARLSSHERRLTATHSRERRLTATPSRERRLAETSRRLDVCICRHAEASLNATWAFGQAHPRLAAAAAAGDERAIARMNAFTKKEALRAEFGSRATSGDAPQLPSYKLYSKPRREPS